MRISDWSSDVCSSDLLTRLAYEVILSAALTMIDAAPRRRMSLGELTDELADAVEIASGESWDDFSGGINAEAEVSSDQQYATAMLDAMTAGETAKPVQNAISLITILAEKAKTESALEIGKAAGRERGGKDEEI